MKIIKDYFFIFIVFCLTYPILNSSIYAQFSIPTPRIFKTEDVPFMYELVDQLAQDGDIVIASGSGLLRASVDGATNLFGIISQVLETNYPFIVAGEKPVVRSGVAYVKVTTINGPISYGDPVTSSLIPGKGQKATKSGYIVGFAMETLKENVSKQFIYNNNTYYEGNIKVALLIDYHTINKTDLYLTDRLKQLFPTLNTSQQTIGYIRLLLSLFVALIGIIISYLNFVRTVSKSAIAIKRNPAIKRTVQYNLLINIFISVLLAFMSIVAAYIILSS